MVEQRRRLKGGYLTFSQVHRLQRSLAWNRRPISTKIPLYNAKRKKRSPLAVHLLKERARNTLRPKMKRPRNTLKPKMKRPRNTLRTRTPCRLKVKPKILAAKAVTQREPQKKITNKGEQDSLKNTGKKYIHGFVMMLLTM